MQPEDKNAIFQMRFPQKLWYLLNMNTEAILWGGTGRTILLNYRILHNYLQCDHSIFKTTNISSFVRQLNLYGFRKVTSHLQDPLCNSCNPYMHEYVHDYFQYSKPELLNKITRKALAMRKGFKPKIIYGDTMQLMYLTPLQKARRTLREALKKAAQDLFFRNSPKQYCNISFDCEDTQDEFCVNDENTDLDWILNKRDDKSAAQLDKAPKIEATNIQRNNDVISSSRNYMKEENIITYDSLKDEHTNETFPTQFLSMPELDAEPNQVNASVELLAEFKIENMNNVVISKTDSAKENMQNSLNCLLPSIDHDQNDEMATTERDSDNLDSYKGEWDQIFEDIITNKATTQDCGSDLKELYSQISRTIDLLND